MTRLVLMADDDGSLWGFWKNPSSGVGEIMLILGLLALIALVFFIWAAFWRKPRRRRHSYHHASDDPNGGLPQRRKRKSEISRLFRGKRRHRTHHRPERPVNPTLAQVGGLPPSRRERPPGP